jgi:putative flippase GtrA
VQSSSIPSKKARYIVVGALNTAVGYGIGVIGYLLLENRVSLIGIGIICNIVAITFSFVTYKCWVFQTKGQWLTEYARCYLVYGGTAVLGVGLLWLLVGKLAISIWFAQGLIIIITIIVSYLGHNRFTFRRT